ncbi:phytochelatin synthase family protein [Thalassospira profundimaris]|uniref:glutathione gamma-glutamylcysteinyltransferase n=1 Tax=Thalassospira profundimaris TaxID=502049 RepID=A0A367WRJ9_9PROT|nr:phytochelatin synthase family protein [Thalassospira profundimaris]RCK43829.1 glutathione gamma-glutamylcysteinyltransferase [Thalassospira profundimaris]
MKRVILPALAGLMMITPLAFANADELIYLTDAKGTEIFKDAELTGPYFELASYLESEHILTFCGPASIAATMNSLGVKRPQPYRLYPWGFFTQETVFTPENQKVKSYAMVEHDGLILSQIATFFENLGVKAKYHHANNFDEAWLRDTIKATLADPNKRLVANYSRKPIGQVGDGHVSPIAAYDEDTDRALVLDVAKYKYPPVWMTIADLRTAMATIDDGSNKARGLVVVSK